MKPIFFASAAELRAWLEAHHATETELEVGFYKKGARKKGVTYKEAVDEALCFGWIDGVVHGLDAERYHQRYTPRKPRSIWSHVNVAKVEALVAAGRMTPAGLAAYALRAPERTGVYAFESAEKPFTPEQQALFEADAAAWAWFTAQGAGYQRICRHWVATAKKAETRVSRMATLIERSRRGEKIPSQVARPAKKKAAAPAKKKAAPKAKAPRLRAGK